MAIPAFISRTQTRKPHSHRLDSSLEEYRPFLASWLIRMALLLNWHEPGKGERWPSIFSDSDFMTVVGLDEEEFDGASRRRFSAVQCRKILQSRLQEVEEVELPTDAPLFSNISLFDELLHLGEAGQALLLFAALFDLFPTFRDAVASRCEKSSDPHLLRMLQGLTGIDQADLKAALAPENALAAAGLLKINHRTVDLEDKIDLIKGLCGIMLSRHESVDELAGRFLRKAADPSLTLANFPHIFRDTSILVDYLGNAVEARTRGVNILFSGKPGVGKTEYAQALAWKLGLDLYEIAYADEDGDPIQGEGRLRAYSFCQRLLANSPNSLLLFDEVEDVFPHDMGFLRFLFGDDKGGGRQVGGKAWVNRTMEQNPVPAIWISNRISQIDHAYRRRFDYSVAFAVPPKEVRMEIAQHHLNAFNPPLEWLERLAGNEELTPGQLERAAKVALVGAGNDLVRARELVDQTLQRSMSLLDQRRSPGRNRRWTGYSVDWLNIDTDIKRVIDGLKKRPYGSFCFYGVAGTGKSELARYIADEVELQVICRRASDLLDKYVGESEKNIASMFDEARQQNALLVLDEADSFLADRREARHSWEVTQVNELLTQMEAFEGIFICTTNLMEKLDQASLRRFAFKVRFSPLDPDQRWGLFCQELIRLGGDQQSLSEWEAQVRRLERLTPGDFAVAARQIDLLGTKVTPGVLYEQLRRECEVKEGSTSRIGFGGS